MIFSEQQLQFLFWLKSLRTPWLDQFFIVLNWFDTYYFGLALVAAAWLGFSRKWGIRTFYLVYFGSLSCTLAKALFGSPRPCALVEGLNLVRVGYYGFPSGGAMNAILVAGIMVLYWKSRWAWVVGGIYFVLISFSRMYLGVHFPLDVVGGWALGGLVVWLFWRYVAVWEQWAGKHLASATVLSIVLPSLAWATVGHSAYAAMAMAGAGFGIWASRTWDHIPSPPRTVWIGALRAAFGVASTFAIFLATRNPILTSLWFSWLGSISYK